MNQSRWKIFLFTEKQLSIIHSSARMAVIFVYSSTFCFKALFFFVSPVARNCWLVDIFQNDSSEIIFSFLEKETQEKRVSYRTCSVFSSHSRHLINISRGRRSSSSYRVFVKKSFSSKKKKKIYRAISSRNTTAKFILKPIALKLSNYQSPLELNFIAFNFLP